jgi:L-alanine-DL-glutamate epimerase-like enolase superfamily enzyme
MPQIRWFAAFGITREPRRESIVVRVSDGGTSGWGEASCPGAARFGWSDLEGRAESAVLECEWDSPEQLTAAAGLRSPYATAALDMACWDLWCRSRGIPLAHALGATRTSVVAGARLTAQRMIDTLLVQVNRHISAGYARITLEITPGWDIEPVRAVRHAFPALALQIDAAGAYTESPEHLAALEALDGYEPVAIERPFPATDLAAHGRLQSRTRAAVAPEIADLETLDTAIADAAGRALALRPGAVGGISAARRMHERAHAAGWELWCDGGPGYGVERAAAVALAALPGCTLPSDLTTLRAGRGVVTPPVQTHGGVIAVPYTGSGLGHEIDEDDVHALATQALRVPA